MRSQLVFICFLAMLTSCKRGNHQVVELKNASLENIYFLISENKVPTTNEVASIRPITFDPTTEVVVAYEDIEQAKSIKHNLYRNRIESDSVGTLLTSESAAIFINAITIQSVIEDRYDGQLHIFIISENDLHKSSNEEIIDEKLYVYFRSIIAEDIAEDTLTFEYF